MTGVFDRLGKESKKHVFICGTTTTTKLSLMEPY